MACNSKRFFLIKWFTISAIQLACLRVITLSKIFTIIFTVWIFSPKCQTCLFQSASSLNEKHKITEVKCRYFKICLCRWNNLHFNSSRNKPIFCHLTLNIVKKLFISWCKKKYVYHFEVRKVIFFLWVCRVYMWLLRSVIKYLSVWN